jgi:hypothetical protein
VLELDATGTRDALALPDVWKDFCHALDGGALRGTRHNAESCVVGGPDLVIAMGKLYALQ